ncbi:MAG: asparagine synthase (glutamine-hydrolyzing) [Candidatus Azotimanducaceae bacterium]|jgi:asparagine synthase (glutamine-hydrolysing)
MCGIAGVASFQTRNPVSSLGVIAMGGTMTHRGPDASGFWFSDSGRVGLCHRRLSIQDLSESGRQPMASATGRYMTSFNGEVYNYQELRDELRKLGARFETNTDTEVILAAVERWGIDSAVKRFIGMFAIAIYDCKEDKLFLLRDRVGIKPLYFLKDNGKLIFASEATGIVKYLGVRPEINRESLSLYLKYGYVPGNNSIYRNVVRLEAGGKLELDCSSGNMTLSRFWDVAEVARLGIESPTSLTVSEQLDHLQDLLRSSIKYRMLADVPVGAFLSGGIDSTTVVAMMQEISPRKIKTFSIGFHEKSYNEAHHAKAIAGYLDTDHTEMYVTVDDLKTHLPKIFSMVDEPFSDISVLPTTLVSQLARKDVTVSLSGDGGDELFCGYSHYNSGHKMRHFSMAGIPFKNTIGRRLTAVNGSVGKIPRMGGLMAAESHGDIVVAMLVKWQDTSDLLMGVNAEDEYESQAKFGLDGNIKNYMMLRDMQRYMVDDILYKVDRASMIHSLEARVPLLDHRVVEFAWSIPVKDKIHAGEQKWHLKNILERYVPREMFERPKQGFGVPISQWLREDLASWAEGLLFNSVSSEFFNQKNLRILWNQHQSRKYDRGSYLWAVLAFIAWYEAH